jgi:hypothetical protein
MSSTVIPAANSTKSVFLLEQGRGWPVMGPSIILKPFVGRLDVGMKNLETPDVAGLYRVDHVDLRSFDIVAQDLLDVSQAGRDVVMAYTMYSYEPEDWVHEKHPDLERQLELARESPQTTVTEEQRRGVIAASDPEEHMAEVWIDGDINRQQQLYLESRRFLLRSSSR